MKAIFALKVWEHSTEKKKHKEGKLPNWTGLVPLYWMIKKHKIKKIIAVEKILVLLYWITKPKKGSADLLQKRHNIPLNDKNKKRKSCYWKKKVQKHNNGKGKNIKLMLVLFCWMKKTL